MNTLEKNILSTIMANLQKVNDEGVRDWKETAVKQTHAMEHTISMLKTLIQSPSREDDIL